MNRVPVGSTTLSSGGYDADSKTLELEFVSGNVYQCFDVPENVYADLMNADSKGKFFNTQTRAAFPYVAI